MAKYDEILALAKQTSTKITASAESWKQFLRTTAYNYQYAFTNQLLIFAQRPDAAMVAPMAYWNETAHRWVQRGAKGIALIAAGEKRAALRYVFDLRDTYAMEQNRKVLPWEVTDANRAALLQRYAEQAGAEQFTDALSMESATLIAERRQMFKLNIQKSITGSTLEWADEAGREQALEQVVQQSAAYMAALRCGLPTEKLPQDAFDYVPQFDTEHSALCLGNAVNQVSRNVLAHLGAVAREIDSVAPKPQKQHNEPVTEATQQNRPEEVQHHGTHLHEHQQLSNPEPDHEQSADTGNRQVRQPASDVFAAERPADLRGNAAERDAVFAPAGNGTGSAAANRPDNEGPAGTKPGTQPQHRPDGLDAADEQRAGAGRGTGVADAVQPVTPAQSNNPPPAESEQLSAFSFAQSEQPADADRGIDLATDVAAAMGLSSPEEQQSAIAKTAGYSLPEEIQEKTGEHITEADIVRAVCSGSGFAEGKMRIAYRLSQPASEKEYADFLKKEYGIGGRSWTFADGNTGWLEHDGKGFSLRYRSRSQGTEPCYRLDLKWNILFRHIRYQIENGTYLTEQEKEAYPHWLEKNHPEQSDLVQSDPAMQQAKDLIAQYIALEFDADAAEDFAHLDSIPLAFTTTEDEQHTIEAEADLLRPSMRYLVDNEVVQEDKYVSLQDMVEQELSALDFDSLISVGMEYAEKLPTEKVSKAENAPEQRETKPLAPGDVVYLENDKLFLVESIGLFDVHLRDESFPLIGRAVSRTEFTRLLAANERNSGLVLPKTEPAAHAEKETPQKNKQNPQQNLQPTMTTEPVATYSAAENGLPYDISIEKLHIEPPVPVQEPAPESSAFVDQVMEDVDAISALSEPYHYDPINYTAPYHSQPVGGPKERFAANIEAIRTLKTIEQRMANGGTPANVQEQDTLAKYVGWGGLADAFEPGKATWSAEYNLLKGLLTEPEYAAARESTLTAFFTPNEVIHPIYRALERMGVTGGNILEPSMGVGAFFGNKPSSFDQSNAKLYGVELDDLTGRMAKQLYQKAKIQITGFEKAHLPDSFFDCAIGNVPFGDFSVSDRPYDRLHFRIHDYFIAKAIDKVRVGGIMAFITTSGTLDKKSEEVRKYIAARCDLIGAVRLPNTTFQNSAGTKAVADILFLQKRDRILEQDVPWLHIAETEDGIPVNGYFAEHPEMVCGEIQMTSGPYGPTATCAPRTDTPLEEQLDNALQNLQAQLTKAEPALEAENPDETDTLEADPNVRNFSYTLVEGKLYFRENSVMRRVNPGPTAEARIRRLIAMRDTVRDLIEAQLQDAPDETITRLQGILNHQYDDFHRQHGLINSRGCATAFRDDSSYFLLCSLEDLDDEGNYRGKTDMFTKRTIRAAHPVEHVDTAAEALALSLGEQARVDLDYMANLTGKSKDELVADLAGVIFRDPAHTTPDGEAIYLAADDYLSGNVREKLAVAKLAAASDTAFTGNVRALEQVQPKDLEASEIAVRLGATWVPVEYIKQFADEIVDAPFYDRRSVKVNFASFTGEWSISNKSAARGNIKATVTYGTPRANFYEILESALNLRAIKIRDKQIDPDGKVSYVLNKKATEAAQAKQRVIEDAFKEWIFKEPERRQTLVALYNEKFNSIRPREYDGSHLKFPGMNPEINLRPHQVNAIAHILYGNNVLLAHEVGAGKSATRS